MAKLIFVDEDHNLNAIKNIADAVDAADAVTLQQLDEAIAGAGSPLTAGLGIDIADDVVSVKTDPLGSLSLDNKGLSVDVADGIGKNDAGALYVNVGNGLHFAGDNDDHVTVLSEDGSISVLPTGIAVNVGKGIVKAPVVGDIGVNVDDVSVKIVNDQVSVDPTWLAGQVNAGVKVNATGGIMNTAGAGGDELAVRKQQAGALRSDANGMFVLHKPSGHTGSDNQGLFVDVASLVNDPAFIAGTTSPLTAGDGIDITADVVSVKTSSNSGIANGPNGLAVDVADGIGHNNDNGSLYVILGDGLHFAGVDADFVTVNPKAGGHVGVDPAGVFVDVESLASDPVFVAGVSGGIKVDPDGGLLSTSGAGGDEWAVKKQQAGALRSDVNGMFVLHKPAGHTASDNTGLFVDVTSLLNDPVFVGGVGGIAGDAVTVAGTAPVTVVDDGAGGYTVGVATGFGITTTGGTLEAAVDPEGGLTSTSGFLGDSLAILPVLGGGILTGVEGASVDWTVVPPPSGPNDAVNKEYVDQIASGMVPLAAVRAATTGPIDLSTVTTLDGVALAPGDRFLVKDQADPIGNGIFVKDAAGATRSDDTDEEGELRVGSTVFVSEGAANANASFAVSSVGEGAVLRDVPWTPGVDPNIWVKSSQISGYVAGDGLDLTGNVFSVNAGDGLSIVADDVRVITQDGSLTVGPTGITANVAPNGGLAKTAQGPMVDLAPNSGLSIDSEGLRVAGTVPDGGPGSPAITSGRVVRGSVTSTGVDGETLTFTHNLGQQQVAVDVSVDTCSVSVDVCRPNMNAVSIGLGKAPAGTVFDIVVTG